jgi:uncharacterized protein with von Willebrand factor type A (vWA) domain
MYPKAEQTLAVRLRNATSICSRYSSSEERGLDPLTRTGQLDRIDFEPMTIMDVATAKRVIALLRFPAMAVPTRQFGADPRRAQIDIRTTLRG